MYRVSRRGLLEVLTGSLIMLIGQTKLTMAQARSAVLVAPSGYLESHNQNVAGMTVCAGAVGSPGDVLMRRRGAHVINLQFAERVQALESGICEALIFVSSEKSVSELMEEISIFFPEVRRYEMHVIDVF